MEKLLKTCLVVSFTLLLFFHVDALVTNITIVVSKDGMGDFKFISDAIASIPDKNKAQYIVYIKKGIYEESVYIGKDKYNVALVGDGVGETIVTFNKSNKTGFSTSESATLDVNSFISFVARKISIINSAGENAGQAVALRSNGENDAYHLCSIEGFQDTLFVIGGKRKFFYHCFIYGTVDIIFGDTKVIFQRSYIYIRQHPFAVVTANSRSANDSDTGIVIHNCTVTAAGNFSVHTFLGRPWRDYSRTIVMQSYLGNIIEPQGWTKFTNDSNVDHLDYKEYANSGPGAETHGRVNWTSFTVITNPVDVLPYTVDNFINGSSWLPQNGIPFVPGFI